METEATVVRPGKGARIGRYLLERPLGKGAMGAVFLACDEQGEKVAVKFLHAPEGRHLDRFRREARVGLELRHPNLVETHELGEHDGAPYLVLGFVEGETLESLLEQHGRLDPAQVVDLARQVTLGLSALHGRGLVHRDLKPANLMIDRRGVVKVMDLGLLRAPDRTALTKTGTLLGTPIFMAPEQFLGQTPTPAADLFSLALILQKALTGNHAFYRPTDMDFLATFRRMQEGERRPWNPDSPDGPLARFFDRALALPPGRRPRDARALAGEFTRAAREEFDLPGPTASKGSAAISVTSLLPLVEEVAAAAGALPGAPPVADTRSTALARSTGQGLRLAAGGVVLLALAALLWTLLPMGRRAPVKVESREGLMLPEGHLVVVRTEEPATLRLRDGDEALRSHGDRTHALRIPPGRSLVQVEGPSGEAVLGIEVADFDWLAPTLLEERYTGDGALLLEFPRPRLASASLRHGDAWVPPAPDPGAHLRFRIPLGPGERTRSLELSLQLPGEAFRWRRLPGYGPPTEERDRLLRELATLDPERLLEEAGAGLDAGKELEALLEERGLARRGHLLQELLEADYFELGEHSEALSKLALLESALLLEGRSSPFDPEERFLEGELYRESLRSPQHKPEDGRLDADEACLRYANMHDFFQLDTSRSRLHAQGGGAGLGLLSVRELGPQELPVARPAPVAYWLDLHTYQWRGHYYARVTVNGRGPWFLSPDPRPWADDPEKRPILDLVPMVDEDFRSLRLRLPAGLVREENVVELAFMPYPSVADEVRPYLLVHRLRLYPAE